MTLLSKDELRRRLRKARASLSPPVRARKSAEVVNRIRNHPAYQSARYPALYYPIGSEVDLLPLIEERMNAALHVLLPVVREGEGLEFHQVSAPLSDLRRSRHGVPEPTPDSTTHVPPAQIDLVLAPGVGFDPAGNRLGQGGGYYDRFLDSLPVGVPRLGVAFDCQVAESIPTDAWDRPVNEVLTERTRYSTRTVEFHSGSIEETHRMAALASRILSPPEVVRLTGSLGAGKTEWVRGLAHALGWTGRVRSPSFSLENVYELPEVTLYHLDGYRLTDPSGLDRDWFEEILEDPRGIVLIEWPDRFGESVPRFAPDLHIDRLENEKRRIVWTSQETRHALGDSVNAEL